MKAGEFLAHSRDVLEAPFRLVPEAINLMGPLHPSDLWVTGSPQAFSLASDWLARQQPREDIEAMRDALALALDAPPDRSITALALANMLEAFPNAGKETRETYFASLMHDVTDEGVGPYLLAEACKVTRRTAKFLPTVSEMLTAVASVRYPAKGALDRLASILTCLDRCEEIVAAHAAPAEWSDAMWMDALLAWGRDGLGIWADHLGPAPDQPGTIVPASAKAAYRARVEYRA